MSYRFDPKENSAVEASRIVTEQFDKALDELRRSDRDAAIHGVRKRLKKIRAVLRIVRPHMQAYADQNKCLRDIAALLSGARDATACVEAYDGLLDGFGDAVDHASLNPTRRALRERRNRVVFDRQMDAVLESVRRSLERARATVPHWDIASEGVPDLADGLAKTYKRGRKAMMAALDQPTAPKLHEWRKRTKYHRYHCRLMRGAWKPVYQGRRKAAKRLSSLLGEDRDLALLHDLLSAHPDEFGGAARVDAILALIGRRRERLLTEAREEGKRVYARKPGAQRAEAVSVLQASA